MTKDEMKNRISMALKDPILQQGFEIICKNLIEFEKENAELKQLVEWLDMAIDSDIPIADKLAELEKENAELNKKLSKAEADYDKMFWNKNEIISKAKELLRMVIHSYNHKERFSFEKDLRKAEIFLKGK